MKIITNIQNQILFIIKKDDLLKFLLNRNGIENRIIIDIIKAITPPILLGIDRRMAYANRKYHSGWIWGGVTMGFASIKLSESDRSCGNIRQNEINIINIIINPIISLKIKNGWKGILSKLLFKLSGLFDPFTWRNIKWTTTIKAKIKGKMKCKDKNRDNVALLMEKPPQIQITIEMPIFGIAEIKFVITVAPQKDIWPQGRTYPINAVIINKKRIIIPENQVNIFVYRS